MIFSEKQKDAIKYLIDKEASRWYILDCLRDEEYWEREYLLFKDMTDQEIHDGITEMDKEGILTEGCKENQRDYGNIVVTEWKPNTAADIRRENEEAKRDPDKYESKKIRRS